MWTGVSSMLPCGSCCSTRTGLRWFVDRPRPEYGKQLLAATDKKQPDRCKHVSSLCSQAAQALQLYRSFILLPMAEMNFHTASQINVSQFKLFSEQYSHQSIYWSLFV